MIWCENPELYKNKSIIILINFLFSQFKFKILYSRLPLYMGQIATFLLAIVLDDKVTDDGYVKQAPHTI